MRYAVFGGSFDPVHRGHLRLAAAVAAAGYDRVILVPAACSPFKDPAGQGEPAAARLDLLLAAARGDRRLTVDTCEITRGGVSYTIDTLRDIYERYVPEGKLGLVIGDDLAADFYKWKDAEEIARETDLIIARRIPGAKAAVPFPYRTIENEPVDAASEDVRALCRAGGAWEHLVPPAVRALITGRRLYTGKALPPDPPPVRFDSGADPEDAARAMLDAERFLHTRNVALHAADLCERYGLDAEKGWRAGLCHDMCKALSHEELFRLAGEDGAPFSPLELSRPGLLHGRAAACLARSALGIEDEEILEAVRFHTSGKAGCGSLAKIVYIADKIEAGRYTVERRLRVMAFGPPPYPAPEALFETVVKATAAWITGHGLELAEETRELLASF